MSFHQRGLEYESRKSRDTWNKFGLGVQSEAGQRLTEFCQKNALVRTPSSNNTRDDSTHGQYQMINTKVRLIISLQCKMEKLYTVRKNKTESCICQGCILSPCLFNLYAFNVYLTYMLI